MAKDLQRLRMVYDRTSGYCHICFKKLSFGNHGVRGSKGAWHIDHSLAKANGGTDHLNNLKPACIRCNEDKGTSSIRSARSKNGHTRAPYSKAKREKVRKSNVITGVVIGGMIGAIAGPLGAAIGATLGGIIGNDKTPRK